MKKDTITITRAEYEHLNKAANAAVEHACELFKASRLVDDLQARIAELEAERDALKDRVVDLEECVWDINGYAWVVDTENAALEERLAKAKRKLEESVPLSAMNELEGMLAKAEAARDAWFSKYQVLKDRTDNYDFLLSKTREQEKEIYRLVKEINKLGG